MGFQCRNNLVFMLRTEGFHGDPKLYGIVSVNAYKLIMLQLDHIALQVGNNLR